MALTWGTNPDAAASSKAARANVALEQSCHEAAKRVVSRAGLSEWDYIQAVLRTAQEIKLERTAR